MPRKSSSSQNSSPDASWRNKKARYVPFIFRAHMAEKLAEIAGDSDLVASCLCKITQAGCNLEFGYIADTNMVMLQLFRPDVRWESRLYIQFWGHDLFECLQLLTLAHDIGALELQGGLTLQTGF